MAINIVPWEKYDRVVHMPREMEGPPRNNNTNAAKAAGTDGAADDVTTLPTALLTRIMRRAMPPCSKIARDAKEVVNQCFAEFAAALANEAAQECRRQRRVIVTADDLVAAMESLGFEDYVAPLAEYMRRYRESEGTAPRGRRAAEPAPAAAAAMVAPPPPPPPPPSQGPALGRRPAQPPCDVTELAGAPRGRVRGVAWRRRRRRPLVDASGSWRLVSCLERPCMLARGYCETSVMLE
ncbi:hypothetical protein ACP70R_047214 [Stipagrostis hirtigluma subsp. patula]